MRTIKTKTLQDIIKRNKREIRNHNYTHYRVNYITFGYDKEYFAILNTKNKEYIFQKDYVKPENDYILLNTKKSKERN